MLLSIQLARRMLGLDARRMVDCGRESRGESGLGKGRRNVSRRAESRGESGLGEKGRRNCVRRVRCRGVSRKLRRG